MSPNIACAFYVLGDMSLGTAVASMLGEIVGGILSFPVMMKILPEKLFAQLSGPSIMHGMDVESAMIIESLLSFTFTLILIVAVKRMQNTAYVPTVLAVTIRGLILIGSKWTGASFNVRFFLKLLTYHLTRL